MAQGSTELKPFDQLLSADFHATTRLSADLTVESSATQRLERGKSFNPLFSGPPNPTSSYRITRAFMIEELNSIKQKATVAEGQKKKGKKGGKKATKK